MVAVVLAAEAVLVAEEAVASAASEEVALGAEAQAEAGRLGIVIGK